MSNKQFKSALRRLHNGIPIYRKGETAGPHKCGLFRVEHDGRSYRGIVIVNTDQGDSFVSEIWEVPRLDWLRRIVCGYYPAVAKAFGPARQFSGV